MYRTDQCVCWTANLYKDEVKLAEEFKIFIKGDKIITETDWSNTRYSGMNIRPIYY